MERSEWIESKELEREGPLLHDLYSQLPKGSSTDYGSNALSLRIKVA